MIQANTIVGGRYRVMKPLGGGGMKLVYLAEDLRLAARPCALAEMVDSFTSPDMQKQAVAAFQREADMLAQLSNEHIPRVFDRFSDENRHYLVMEYIEGLTLEQKLKDNGGKLGEVEVIDLALQVLDTLGYLHNLEPPVIYRDLKPSNVMLMPSGLVKLIDFGIARLFQPLSNATMIGTQGYAPPEQYRGKVESRSDLYALGATMHHALSGRDPAVEPPFSSPPLRSVAPAVAPALAEIVDQALQYDVILRMADALEFKNRLLAIKNGTAPVQAPILTRNSTGTGGERPQLKLPLTGLQYKPPPQSSPSAPTILSDAIDAQCPRCSRQIPVDSNFCSFCATDVTGHLRSVANAAPDAQTIFLDEPAEPMTFPERDDRPRRSKRNPVRTLLYIVGGAFLVGYLMFRPSSQPDTDTTSYPPPGYGGAAPDTTEPVPSEARTIALRRALNSMGYQSVHFKLEGDTIILWGTVPTEADRIMVQTQVFLVARIFSLEDHLQVQNAFAEP
ncbi:MAG: protein kinase [Candidatus Binatus sp.]|uniref:serine/threonine protein kinase n=1 Tax=Candidatus Binatus sp. TaxID=2811406 RepID=UPI00271EA93F|nr:protein kinase [Candidatus Binatus sp.]MDO8430906.1 protein kinase [Candidatus Binatus sp.]